MYHGHFIHCSMLVCTKWSNAWECPILGKEIDTDIWISLVYNDSKSVTLPRKFVEFIHGMKRLITHERNLKISSKGYSAPLESPPVRVLCSPIFHPLAGQTASSPSPGHLSTPLAEPVTISHHTAGYAARRPIDFSPSDANQPYSSPTTRSTV